MSRKTMALLVSTLLTASIMAPAASAQEPAFVFAFDDGATYVVPEGTEIILGYGWAAKTKGQVRTYVAATRDSFHIQDAAGGTVASISVDEAKAFWGPLFKVPTTLLGLSCKKAEFWASLWEYDLGTLPPGEYTLTATTTLTHPVNDGYHTCEDIPAPSLYPAGEYGPATVTIIIE